MIDSDLYKNVLRACQYNDRISSGTLDSLDHHHKIVGSHLLLGKRSSTPIGTTNTSNHQYNNNNNNHQIQLSASLLTAAGIDSSPSSCHGSISPPNTTPDMLDPNCGDPAALGVVATLHRRLDRSQSEPVWQQQQLQPQDGRQGTNSSRYKTELCRPYEENGFCKYGDKCQFAHGGSELRTLNRHPKYKTELCRTFHTIGICPYGPRCHFIHNAEESRVLSPVMAAGPMPPLTYSAHHMGGGSPPPLVPSTVGLHSPLRVSPTIGLPTIFDKNSPPSSIHGSPTSAGVFFDETAFSLFQGNILEGLAESLANSLHLNNKVTFQANLSNQINNHLNNNHITTNNNTINNSKTQLNGGGGFNDLMSESSSLEGLDTPPASPPDTSTSSSSSSSTSSAADRLPIFQSMNLVQ